MLIFPPVGRAEQWKMWNTQSINYWHTTNWHQTHNMQNKSCKLRKEKKTHQETQSSTDLKFDYENNMPSLFYFIDNLLEAWTIIKLQTTQDS